MSIKKAILEKNEGNDVEKSEYVNLILDDMNIGEISDEDKQFLEGFTETQFLSLNSTQLKSIQNLPKMQKLDRLELNDNKIGAFSESQLQLLPELYENLRVLKISNNQIKTIEEIACLTKCEKLESLDLSNNPLAATEDYTAKVRELLPKVDILDGFNKEGQEIVSEDEDSEEDSEDGEGEGEDEEGEGEEDDQEGSEDEEEEGEEEGDEEQPDDQEQEETAQDAEAVVGTKRKNPEPTAMAEAEANNLDVAKKRVNVE